jgi:methyl-accepting chemotaxis protein
LLTWSVVTQKLAAEESQNRLQQMVDNMPLNVITANAETLEINYVNNTSIETLKTVEQYLPIKADELMGQCIDIFHKNPAHQRALLADPSNPPHKAIIDVGPEKLDLLVSAVNDADGKRQGGPLLALWASAKRWISNKPHPVSFPLDGEKPGRQRGRAGEKAAFPSWTALSVPQPTSSG